MVITISSALSGTCQSATIAAQRFEGRVQVVDSMNASIGTQILVRRALQLLPGAASAAGWRVAEGGARARLRDSAAGHAGVSQAGFGGGWGPAGGRGGGGAGPPGGRGSLVPPLPPRPPSSPPPPPPPPSPPTLPRARLFKGGGVQGQGPCPRSAERGTLLCLLKRRRGV